MKAASWIWVGIGGGIGAVSRAVLSDALDGAFPWGILTANLLGAWVLGLLYRRKESIGDGLWEFCGVGFCGGFTTVSTYAFQSVGMMAAGEWVLGLSYYAGSVFFAGPMVYLVVRHEFNKLPSA